MAKTVQIEQFIPTIEALAAAGGVSALLILAAFRNPAIWEVVGGGIGGGHRSAYRLRGGQSGTAFVVERDSVWGDGQGEGRGYRRSVSSVEHCDAAGRLPLET